MGLSFAISAGIIMTVVLYVILLIPGFVDSTIELSEAASDISKKEKIIADTEITLASLVMANATDTVQFQVNNVGLEKLWNFEKFSIIVSYNGTTSGSLTETFEYAGDCGGLPPAVGNWCKDSMINDLQDPEILNGDESMTVGARLSESIFNGIGIITVSTDNGIVAYISKTI